MMSMLARNYEILSGLVGTGLDSADLQDLELKGFYPGIKREEIFSPAICSDYMKKQFHHIGRGVVCGICMQVCPYTKK